MGGEKIGEVYSSTILVINIIGVFPHPIEGENMMGDGENIEGGYSSTIFGRKLVINITLDNSCLPTSQITHHKDFV